MKKILIAAVLLLSVSYASIAGNTKTIDPKTLAAFSKEFSTASNVSWQEESSFSKATFTINGSVLFAYYSTNGELIASSRNISSTQLPLHLFTTLKNDYNSYWITDLFELAVNDTTEYYVTLENAGEKRILRSNSYGWEMFDSVIKD